MFTAKDRETSYYQRPVQTPPPAEPLLVDLNLCVDRCRSCGKPIDKYPRHTHRERDSGYAVRYECICHKCVPVPMRRR